VAELRAKKALRYILEPFEPQPLPVSVVYAHARLRFAAIRAFVDACREGARTIKLV
jgi:DNA-binding transcriptional LysR family regulator